MREIKAVQMIVQGLITSAYLLMQGIVLTCPHQTLWIYNNPEFEMVKRFGVFRFRERSAAASLKMNFDFYESQAF